MKIYYDDYQRPEPSKIYLATPYHKILCGLNGIKEDTVSLSENLNNAYELSFEMDRFIMNDAGEQIESNGYDWVQHLMRLYVDNIGWFICSPPTVSNDGVCESKSVVATSCEIEMVQHDIKGLKINCGTTDSYEILVEGNVTTDDSGVERFHNPILFCNKENPELSLLHILLKVTGLRGWTIGHIDDIPKEYKSYVDGKLVTTYTSLSDEKGRFDIELQDLYSFLTQTVAQYFGCIFIFDIKNLIINAYRPENLGKDTNINIGFRNIQNSNDITVDENNIFTTYIVSGSDDLGITYVNGGSNQIENIDYFLNQKYLSANVIDKYKMWQQDVEALRPEYIELTRLYNAQLDVVSELKNRLPLDDCSTDWSTFEDEKLVEAISNYIAQLKGYEQSYVDDNNEFDKDALDASVDAVDYYQIKDVILPSILTEFANRYINMSDEELISTQLIFETQIDEWKDEYVDENGNFDEDALLNSEDGVLYTLYFDLLELIESERADRDAGIKNEPQDYEDSYKTQWELYGLDELQVKISEYKNIVAVAQKGKYDVPYTEDSGHTEDYHTALYEKYLDALNQLDENYSGSCKEAYNQRQVEIDAANELLDFYNEERQKIAEMMDKSTWSNGLFTESDLAELSKIYVDNTYTNENMFLVTSDTSVTAIDEQLKLLEAAKDDLSIASQPQFTYTTSLDNFLAQYEYKDYTNVLNLGDFVWLGVRDDYVVKLRVISISYNPLLMDNNLQIEFSNMVRSRAKRDDFTYLLGGTTGRGKSASTGSGGDYTTNEGVGLTSGLISKLLANGSFKNTIGQWVEDGMAINGNTIIVGSGGSGGEISIEQLNSKMIKVVDIIGENAFFEYLQSKLISAEKIVADNGAFKDLSAIVAKIDNLIAGKMSAEDFHALRLTTKNAVIDEAVIRDLIAANITVSMLKAGVIDTNQFNISSKDGGLTIVGNTMQFTEPITDENGNLIMDESGNPKTRVRIQIGRDSNNNFTFTLYDSEGKGVLLDEHGIHESAISDGLIRNEMIAEGTIEKDKLGFPIIDTDENGKVSITDIKDGSGKEFGVIFTEMQSAVAELGEKIENANFYNIVLGNEYQIIPCIDGFAKYQFTIEIPFTGYIGTTQTDTVAVHGELPHGVILGGIQNATTTTEGLITLIVQKDADFGGASVFSGKIPISFTINGVTITKNFTWAKTNDGSVGVAQTYSLESSVDIIIRTTDENNNTTLSPSNITFSAHINEEEKRGDYSGRFIIQTSVDGGTYSNVYISSDDEWTTTYSPASDVRYIKCFLCKSGDITAILETKTVTVLDDNSQTLSEITKVTKTVTQLSSIVDNNEKAIKDEIWKETIITEKDENGNVVSGTINSLLVNHEVSLNGISSTVKEIESDYYDKDGRSLSEKFSTINQTVEMIKSEVIDSSTGESKIEQMADQITFTIDGKINEISTSSRNLLRNSKTLIFPSYGLLSNSN